MEGIRIPKEEHHLSANDTQEDESGVKIVQNLIHRIGTLRRSHQSPGLVTLYKTFKEKACMVKESNPSYSQSRKK
jgi:hypothetical protein